MPIIKPQTQITSVREHGLKVLNLLADKHGVSNVHFLTCAILHIGNLSSVKQVEVLEDGHSIDLMIRMGCRLDDNGNLDYSHITDRQRKPTKES